MCVWHLVGTLGTFAEYDEKPSLCETGPHSFVGTHLAVVRSEVVVVPVLTTTPFGCLLSHAINRETIKTSQAKAKPHQANAKANAKTTQSIPTLGLVWFGCSELAAMRQYVQIEMILPHGPADSIGRDRRSPRRWYCSQSCQAKAEPRWRTGAEDGTGADRSGPWGPCKGENHRKPVHGA